MIRCIPLLACLLVAASPLMGQLHEVGAMAPPGALRNVGTSSLDAFRHYSSGSPGQSGLGQGGNSLQVPLSSSAYSSFRSGAGSVLESGSAGGASLAGRPIGAAPGIMIVDSSGARPQPRNYLLRGGYGKYAPPPSEDMALTEAAQRQELITSLAPRTAGIYTECIRKGEERFKAGQYTEAFSSFESAGFIGHDDAESLLSMSHAQFAQGSYATAGYYLCRAILKRPDLAQVKLSPKGFYGLAADYVQRVIDLEEYTQQNPQDANGWLLLAYYNWFDDPSAPAKATRNLSQALSTSKDPKLVEAVEVLYGSMLRTGKVTGKLVAATQPSTQPAVAKP